MAKRVRGNNEGDRRIHGEAKPVPRRSKPESPAIDFARLEAELKQERAANERHRLAAEATTNLIYEWDLGKRVNWYGKVDELLGYAPKKFPRTLRAWMSRLHPKDRERVLIGVKKKLKSEEPYCLECRVRRRDGTYLYWLDRGSVAYDDTGKPHKWIGAVTDITEFKRSEKELLLKNALLEAQSETSLDGVLAVNGKGQMILSNKRFGEMWNIPSELLLARNDEKMLAHILSQLATPEKFIAKVKHLYKHHLEKSRDEIVLTDGRIFDRYSSPLLFRDGASPGRIWYFRDVTELRRSEAILRRSEERFRTLFLHSPVGVALIDRDARLLDVNAILCRMLGYSREELLHLTGFDLTHPEDRERSAAFHRSMVKGTSAGYTIDKQYVRKDGTNLWATTTQNGIKGEDGKFSYSILVVQDISERKQSEASLKLTAEKLRKMTDGTIRAMTSVLEMRDPYTAGHELRVAQLACAIAAEMGLPELQIEGIRFASYLHDIGKIAVPAEILSKPGKISENEFGIIKAHPQFAYDILKEIDFPWPVALSAYQHHERMNGSGYPQGLSGKNIILEARIMAVADVVEAMSSHRPYRPALGIKVALKEITTNRGILYDAQAVDACVQLFSRKQFEFK